MDRMNAMMVLLAADFFFTFLFPVMDRNIFRISQGGREFLSAVGDHTFAGVDLCGTYLESGTAGSDGRDQMTAGIKDRGADAHGTFDELAEGKADFFFPDAADFLPEIVWLGDRVCGVSFQAVFDIVGNEIIALECQKHFPVGTAVQIDIVFKTFYDLDPVWTFRFGDGLAVIAV